ncbi:MAG: 2-oxo acid dehydrogenase subunit E2 [Lentimicrobiaceae bacterium]|jgi:pyruvate/2-oxoglutarate dehydrogenase complex dihydrolipoamide acyltransferase (E2) component
MKKNVGYKVVPLTFNRRAVMASATVTKEKNTIHGITEVDITEPRRLMQKHFERTGEKLSLTAYIVTCLAHVLKDHPLLNSFHKGRKQIILDNVTVSVLVEREINGEKVPEPIGISKAETKTYLQIHNEIRDAQRQRSDYLGSFSGMSWARFIPDFLFLTFIRIADHNIRMAKRYGKVCVTAVGMFGRDAVWFVPHGSATVLVTVGGINRKIIKVDEELVEREHLCLTVSFDHNIVDGSPAARFMKQFSETVKSGNLLNTDNMIIN